MRHYTELKQRVQSLAETESLSLPLSWARIPLKIFQEYLYAALQPSACKRKIRGQKGMPPNGNASPLVTGRPTASE